MDVIKYLKLSLFPFDDGKTTLLEKCISIIILASVVTLVLETEITLYSNHIRVFEVLEKIFLLFFSIEYLSRLFFADANKKYRGLKGRLKYIISPFALIDLFAILPSLIAGLYPNLMLLRSIRLLRMFRIVKLVKSNKSLMLFIEAFLASRIQLIASLGATLLLLFIGAVLLYIAEGQVQPEAFGSIPRAMWWSMATLTTVGYGDAYPITVLGKILASLIAILGIGIVAMPAGIIAANFSKKLAD